MACHHLVICLEQCMFKMKRLLGGMTACFWAIDQVGTTAFEIDFDAKKLKKELKTVTGTNEVMGEFYCQ